MTSVSYAKITRVNIWWPRHVPMYHMPRIQGSLSDDSDMYQCIICQEYKGQYCATMDITRLIQELQNIADWRLWMWQVNNVKLLHQHPHLLASQKKSFFEAQCHRSIRTYAYSAKKKWKKIYTSYKNNRLAKASCSSVQVRPGFENQTGLCKWPHNGWWQT